MNNSEFHHKAIVFDCNAIVGCNVCIKIVGKYLVRLNVLEGQIYVSELEFDDGFIFMKDLSKEMKQKQPIKIEL